VDSASGVAAPSRIRIDVFGAPGAHASEEWELFATAIYQGDASSPKMESKTSQRFVYAESIPPINQNRRLIMPLQDKLDAFKADFKAGEPPYNAPPEIHPIMERDRGTHR
jgi:hypothetical protein